MDRTRQAVALLAMRAYNEYLLSLEKVVVAEKAVKQKQKHLEMAQNRRAAGVATELDVLRSAGGPREPARHPAAAQGPGGPGPRPPERGHGAAHRRRAIEPTDGLDYVPMDVALDAAVRQAWNDRPEAKAIALNERIYDELIGVAQADARPRLDFFGSYGWSVREPRNFFERDFTRWTPA